ncbi:MAG: flagellar biosynthesis protein FlhB [Alphaproteobacteria bacterium]|nr:flagellar biosynthesis protein FlhB [Alphaproteobacteria bacterium]
MADDQASENKTEEPTGRRLSKAREEGSIARSRELPSAIMLMTGAAIVFWGGTIAVSLLERMVAAGLHIDPLLGRDPARLLTGAWMIVKPALEVIIVFGGGIAVIGTLSALLVGGLMFSWRPVMPDLARLDPVQGFARLWSRDALIEIVKSVVKLLGVAAVAYWWLRGEMRNFADLARAGWPGGLWQAGSLLGQLFLLTSFSLAVVVLLEVPYRIWSHRQDLRMSRQELRDEAREVEGNPQTKRRVKQLRRKVARARMMTQVPKADVVLTNPSHVSVALRYQQGTMRAPRMVAKGVGLVALRIREVAAAHEVPVVEAPPLARSLHRYVEIEDEVPVALYRAVAEVLAFVYRLRAARAAGKPAPIAPSASFDPPDELRI